jgi:hypothetical protein
MAFCRMHPVSEATRRYFIARSAALGMALMLPSMAQAGRFRQLAGVVAVNGKPANAVTEVRPLDIVTTGADSSAVLVMGKDALLIRAGSEVELLGKPKGVALTGLRMLTGALLGVFGKGGGRQLLTSTATIGIRGTGIYMEASAEQTYFCTCYGDVSIEDQHRGEKRLVLSGYHSPNIIYAMNKDGAMMQKAQFTNHTDDELVMLEKLVGRKPAFGRR